MTESDTIVDKIRQSGGRWWWWCHHTLSNHCWPCIIAQLSCTVTRVGEGGLGPVIDHVSRSQYTESVSPVTGLYPG